MSGFFQSILHVVAEAEASVRRSRPIGLFRRWELARLGVSCGFPLSIREKLWIETPGKLTIGPRACLGPNSKFFNYSQIIIGEDFLSAGELVINTGSHDPVTLKPFSLPVCIGSRVWIGSGVTILGGVSIGDDAVIGAGSVVIKDVEPGTIVAGIPARLLRTVDRKGVRLWSYFENSH
ncbi:MAG: acyltransferase [Terrimicrobiaceae bacterium]